MRYFCPEKEICECFLCKPNDLVTWSETWVSTPFSEAQQDDTCNTVTTLQNSHWTAGYYCDNETHSSFQVASKETEKVEFQKMKRKLRYNIPHKDPTIKESCGQTALSPLHCINYCCSLFFDLLPLSLKPIWSSKATRDVTMPERFLVTQRSLNFEMSTRE